MGARRDVRGVRWRGLVWSVSAGGAGKLVWLADSGRAGALGSRIIRHIKHYIPTLTHSPLSLVQTDPQLVQELSDEVAMR